MNGESPDCADHSTNELVRTLTPAEIRQMQQPFLAGHERELTACENFMRRLVSIRRRWGVLAFGFPGTAKTTFPQALAFRLNERGLACGLASIKCQSLTARLTVDEVRERLNELDAFFKESTPKVVVFDELDALAPTRKEYDSLSRLSNWALDFFDPRNARVRGSLIFGITNNPYNVDNAVIDRLGSRLYFDLPTKDTIAAILGNAGLPDAKEVADSLWNRLLTRHCRITGRGAHTAAELIRDSHGGRLAGMPPDSLANEVGAYAFAFTQEQVDNYMNRYRALIQGSDGFVNLWLSRSG